MKTIRQYEASDIDIKGNKLHSVLMGQVLVLMISSGEISKPNPADPGDKMYGINKMVAGFLNDLERAGYHITDQEPVPAVFREGMA